MHNLFRDKAVTGLLLLVAFYLIPYSQLDHLRLMPGDIGDARLVNYFLEHNHLYFNGAIESLWHPRYFAPFPFVFGFSENVIGSFPIYEIARSWTTETDTAFQVWFLAAYAINYLAANFALSRLGCTPVSASIGALIFAFSLPVTTHIGHPQLLYRFGLPMAIAMYISFLQNKNWWHLIFSGFWLVWQYYCSIYTGFFTSLLLVIISVAFLPSLTQTLEKSRANSAVNFLNQLKALPAISKLTLVFGFVLLLLAMAWLFYPYLMVSEIYDAKRSPAEIATMLPRIQSYFTAYSSMIWNPISHLFPKIPMQGEHQMFAGAMPLLLAFSTLFRKRRFASASTYSLMLWCFIGSIAATLSVFGYSFWMALTSLPLISAIRVVTRLDLALLFPIAYFSAIAIENFKPQKRFALLATLTTIIILLIGEMSATKPYVSSKAEWRERLIENKKKYLQAFLPIQFYSSTNQRAHGLQMKSTACGWL